MWESLVGDEGWWSLSSMVIEYVVLLGLSWRATSQWLKSLVRWADSEEILPARTCRNRLPTAINSKRFTTQRHMFRIFIAPNESKVETKIRPAHKRFSISRFLIHVSQVWRPRQSASLPFLFSRATSLRSKRRNKRRTDYTFVWRAHRMRSKKYPK